FDTAVTGAMPESTLKVVEAYAADYVAMFRGQRPWPGGLSEWGKRRANSKKVFAEVIGGSEAGVACVPNASTGINTVMSMLPSRRGTNIVATNLSFPMCATVVNKQRERGAKPKFLKHKKGVVAIEQFEKAVNDKTVAVMVDQPSWFNGYLYDLKALAEVCHDHGAKLVIDGTQSIGNLAWEADRWGVDFVACSTYKWVLGGPYGQAAGFLYVTKKLVDEYQPAYVGGQSLTPEESNINTEDAFTLYEFKPRKGIERLEIYSRMELSYVAVENSMRVLLAHGMKNIEKQVKTVDNVLVEELTKKHFRLQTPNEEDRRIYINVQVPDFKAVGKKLAERNVIVSPRIGGLRISPHFYNTEEEAVALVKALCEVTKPR
ncbi:TPA: aminotransferase class V-fold PLP-dependent enzyme, partial [Candidatus Bathyarchaeota archaeon]|nr:aminotransferase class V-fold PLP-dependent enzyme [Candidatus Bathyarchaeota archaeon]